MIAASDTRLNRRSVAPASTSSLVSDTYSEVDFCELDETSGDVTPLAAGILSREKIRKHIVTFFQFKNMVHVRKLFLFLSVLFIFILKASCPLLE